MNIFHFLSKEFFRENVLCLYILPNAVLLPYVTPLIMEKRKKFFSAITLQFMKDGMGSERSKVLQEFAD